LRGRRRYRGHIRTLSRGLGVISDYSLLPTNLMEA
jgi:hypothetical protein